jgi:hypothetical protein
MNANDRYLVSAIVATMLQYVGEGIDEVHFLMEVITNMDP